MAAVPASQATDPRALLKTAFRLAKSQRYPAALATLCQLVDQVDAPAEVFDRGVRQILDLAEDLRLPEFLAAGPTRERGQALLLRAAFFARLYLSRPEDLRALSEDRRFAEGLPIEHALFLAAFGPRLSPPIKAHTRRAAEIFVAHGRLVRAANAFAQAGDTQAAARCYDRLLSSRPAPGRPALGPYEQALIHYQRACRLLFEVNDEGDIRMARAGADDPEIHRHAVAAQGILEQLADDFEARQQPERAIDAYCILIALGRMLGRFEHTAEGFIGCLRLLKNERLITATLHAYEDFLSCCTDRPREHALAGQQAREAAEFLDRCGLPWGDHYRVRAADYFEQAADDARIDPGRRESLLLQALSLWNGLGAGRKAQAVLARLVAEAPAERTTQALGTANESSSRAARYQRLAREYEQALGPLPSAAATRAGAATSEPDRLPTDRALQTEPPPTLHDRSGELPVWDLDLCEWEDAGDPATVAAALLCDQKRPLLCRRHALRIGLLYALGPPWTDIPDPVQARLRAVDALAGLHTYEALRPLEVIFDAACWPGSLSSAEGSNTDAVGAFHGAADPSDPGQARLVLLGPQPPAASTTIRATSVDALQNPDAVQALLSPYCRAQLRRHLIQTLSRLPYRRALQLVLRGLSDPDVTVFAASLEALAQGRYIGSVSLLSRLVQTPTAGFGPQVAAATAVNIRRVALVALSRTRDLRAYSVLLDIYRSEPEPLRSEAFHLLRYALQSDANTVRPLILRATASATPDLQALRALVDE